MSKRTYQIVRMVLAAVALTALASTLYLPPPVRAESTRAAAPLASAASDPSSIARATESGQARDSRVEFEENRGQFDKEVRYIGRAGGSTVFLTATEAVYVLPMPQTTSQNNQGQELFALRMKLVGANADSSFAGEAKREHRTNYFRGNNPENWQTNVPNFSRVRYEGVYDGVAMVWHGQEQGATQYDFVVQPNADAGKIELEFAGADSLETDSDGNLLIHTKAGVVKHGRPFSYQEARGQRAEVASSFVVENNRVRFSVAGYDRSKPLTIDPSVNLSNLAFSTFLGGEATDDGLAIAVDRTGSVYVTGTTVSLLFPTTSGAFDTTNTTQAVFVTKMNAIGTDLIYSTYLDGNALEAGSGIAVDASGNAYVTGFTTSTDFPVTAGTAFDTTFNSLFDVFFTKLNATGSALSYSTYLGGSDDDRGFGIAVDSSGNAYLTGQAPSTNFPTTAGAFDPTNNNGFDAFVSKINPSLSGAASLVYSTYIGGTNTDIGHGVAVDSSGNAYITGETDSSNFPTTAGVFDTVANGSNDVFVTKLNSGGTALTYSTYVGGDNGDIGFGIAVDPAGQAYITGTSGNGTTDYPTTAGAFDTTHNGVGDVFVTKLNATATSPLVYSTFIGGSGADVGNSIALDSFGFIYITGDTVDGATDYPTTAGAFDTTHNGGRDVFVTRLRPTTAAEPLAYSTFIGGSLQDAGKGIAVDSSGNAYVTGETDLSAATQFPTTADAFQPIYNGGFSDSFVVKLGNFAITGRVIDSASGNPAANVMVGMSGHTSNFMLTGTDGRFGFTNTVNSTPYNITASRTNTNVNPNIFNIDSLDSNRDLIFLSEVGQPSAAPAGISGQIGRTDGAPVAGVLIQLSGAQSRRTITDVNGNYHFDAVETGGFYTVRPSQPNFLFSPAERSFSQIGDNTEAAFTGAPIASGVNVIDTAEYFVRQHYVDFLGREPDESGFNFWSDQMLECGANAGCLERRRINVSAAYFLSIEFQETGGLVDGLYRASYGRRPIYVEFVPDSSAIAQGVVVGRTGWEQKLETNKQAFVDAWVQRSVFHAVYDGTANDGYVDQLIAHTGVNYTASERAALVDGLTNGTLTRAAVLRQIVENRSFIRAKFNQTFVMMQYFGYLRRDPDESGYQFWVHKLDEFNGNFEQAEMVKAFLVSGEYRQRFVTQ